MPTSVREPAPDGRAVDVLVVGCGPTGVVLASLLGRLGARVRVLERGTEVPDLPRATHVDEETLRAFQATGLASKLLRHTASFGRADVVDAEGDVLVEHEVRDPGGVHGYDGSRFFDQAAFEWILREGLQRYPNVELELGVEVESIDDRGDGAIVVARDADGVRREHRAAWVVGCDGGRSVTREAAGIELDSLAPPRRWALVDTRLRDPADADRLPSGFRYVLHPERLTVYAHGIGENRRWEFEIDGAEPADDAVVGWIAPFVDPARLEVLRVARYTRLSLVAKRWRAGRVILAGDAAHMMPPSAGQGLCSGVRDALNLAWKLALVARGAARVDLLDTYEEERAAHVRATILGSLFLARRLEADTAAERAARELSLRVLGAVGPLRAVLRPFTAPPRALRGGCLDARSALAGRPCPQTRVRTPRSVDDAWMDDVVGYRPALVTAAPLDAEATAWARARGVGVHRLGADVIETGARLARWLRRHRCEFALVRPDRVVFGAGRGRDLARVRGALDAWIGGMI